MDGINFNIIISINAELDTDQRERLRNNIRAWVLDRLHNQKSSVIDHIDSTISSSGYVEEYDKHTIALRFHLEALGHLRFSNECNFDKALYTEDFISEETVTDMEDNLRLACNQIVQDYEKQI